MATDRRCAGLLRRGPGLVSRPRGRAIERAIPSGAAVPIDRFRALREQLLIPLCAITALLALPAEGRQLAGVEIPERFESEGVVLILNGAGVRTRFFIDVYAAALYLPSRSSDADAILDADEAIAIQLWIVTKLISREAMRKSIEDGFRRSTRGNLAPIRVEMDAFIELFDEEISEGDVFEILYLPGRGLKVRKNGSSGATIECGPSFKRALFGIWIGDRPVQEGLRRALLGG